MNWDDLRARLTPAVIICIILFLLAAAVFGLRYLPAKERAAQLQKELEQAQDTEMMLTAAIAQLPGLEGQRAELTESIQRQSEKIPTQFDLPQVLEFLRATADRFGVAVDKLDHDPVVRDTKNQTLSVMVNMILRSESGLLSYIDEVQKLLPTFQVQMIELARVDRLQFTAQVRGQLFLREIVGQDVYYAWKVPSYDAEGTDSWVPVFAKDVLGWPSAAIAGIVNGGIRVLGAIEREGQRTALITANGTRQWVSQGDWLGDAQVVEVEPKAVTLALGTTKLKLSMGE